MANDVQTLQVDLTQAPSRVAVEPTEALGNRGVWVCDPRSINVLVLRGQNIPYNTVVLFRASEIAWKPSPESDLISSPCPTSQHGGFFRNVPNWALLFGVGQRFVRCRGSFGIDDRPGNPVWVAVNDSNYPDNTGRIVVSLSWR